MELMEIFQQFGSAGFLVITIDDSDPVNIHFNHKITVSINSGTCVNPFLSKPAAQQNPQFSSQVENNSLNYAQVPADILVDDCVSVKEEENALEIGDEIESEEMISSDPVEHEEPEPFEEDIEEDEMESFSHGDHLKTVTPSSDMKVDTSNMNLNRGEEKHSVAVAAPVQQCSSGTKKESKHIEMAGKSRIGVEAKTGSSSSSNHSTLFRFKCEFCSKSFQHRRQLLQHNTINTKTPCPSCNKMCLSKAHLLLHNHFYHNPDESFSMKSDPLKCPLCSSSYKDGEIFSHVRTVHTKEGLLQCCACDEQFQDYPNFQSHQQTHKNLLAKKNEIKTQKITPCVKDTSRGHYSIDSDSVLRIRRKLEKKATERNNRMWTKIWNCSYCEQIFKSNEGFVGHMKPSGVGAICEECPYSSVSKAEVSIHHYASHVKGTDRDECKHLEKDRCYCHICGQYCLKSKLLRHTQIEHTREVIYQCCICGEPCQDFDAWNQHAKSHNEMLSRRNELKTDLAAKLSLLDDQELSKLKCRLCKDDFSNENDFVLHHRNETEQNVCKVCSAPSSTKAGYLVHKYISHGSRCEEEDIAAAASIIQTSPRVWREEGCPQSDDQRQSIQCPCCPQSFPLTDLLFHVMESHTGESFFKCCACDFSCSSKDQYVEHCEFHLGKIPYGKGMTLCSPCNLRFESRDMYRIHFKKHKSICCFCAKEFSSKCLLKVHLHNDHSENMISCEICGTKLETLTKFAVHKRWHHYQKSYQCPICGIMVSKLEEHLAGHELSGPKKKFSCHICAAQFASKSSFKDHMETHIRSKRFTCDLCEKTFKTSSCLASHANVHLKQRKSYECTVCGKKCSQRHNLQIHMRIHSQHKAYKCEFCDQGFRYNQSLQKHISSKHRCS